jgi:fatty acid synthase subunit beta
LSFGVDLVANDFQVSQIQSETGFFVEIVNLNIRNRQYVCAGDLRALDILQRTCDDIKKGTGPSMQDSSAVEAYLQQAATAYANRVAQQVTLKRGMATVPLAGVDVPFHSSLLRPRMPAFRRVLQESLNLERVKPQRLVGKYIPNITGEPFELSKEYIESVYKITGSESLKDVLDNWATWESRVEQEREGFATAVVA